MELARREAEPLYDVYQKKENKKEILVALAISKSDFETPRGAAIDAARPDLRGPAAASASALRSTQGARHPCARGLKLRWVRAGPARKLSAVVALGTAE